MRPALTAAVLAVLALGPRHTAPAQPDPVVDQLAALVTQKMSEYQVPGVAFGIVRDGRVTARGFGVTNVDDPQPITADTVFPIASISKTVTATAIMRLVEQKKIELDAPVRRYLPEFRVQDPAASAAVTIRHLLTHTPGWEGQLTTEDRGAQTNAHFIDTMRELPQLAAPGEVWSYNNAGFTVAGRVIEAVTGQSIHQAIRSLVFQPLGLTRSFTRLDDVATYRFSVAHRPQASGPVVVRPLMRSSSITAGGMAMSLRDMLSYASFHLGTGTGPDGARVLERASLDAMRAPHAPKRGTDDEMGLGWHLRRVGGVLTAAHGGTLGHCLLVEIVPERNLAFAILTNQTDGWRLIQDVERATLNALANVSLAPTQSIAHRGVNETMADAPLLATQPDPAPYVGVYRRPPVGMNTVRVENGQLLLDRSTIAFFAPDRAIVTAGNQRGNPVEFIRRTDGAVGWIRVVGRIARKE